MTRADLTAIEWWDPELCIAYLEQDGEPAPEYDLETAHGVELLRRDCKDRAARLEKAA